jgi:hypothetical protein
VLGLPLGLLNEGSFDRLEDFDCGWSLLSHGAAELDSEDRSPTSRERSSKFARNMHHEKGLQRCEMVADAIEARARKWRTDTKEGKSVGGDWT